MAKKRTIKTKPRERENLSLKTRVLVLTEAGYRCAVPTCRNILALDMHHIWEVSAGGSDDPSNLIALCPTCHALYHRGTISAESIYIYKSMLVMSLVNLSMKLSCSDSVSFGWPTFSAISSRNTKVRNSS